MRDGDSMVKFVTLNVSKSKGEDILIVQQEYFSWVQVRTA